MTAAVVAYAIAVVYVPQTHGAMSTDGSVSTAAHAADLVAGLGLLAAGVFALTELRARRIGLLACLAGVVWFAPDWDSDETNEEIWREFWENIEREPGA